MKNSSDTNGNQTRDLPVCGAVPQPTALPAAYPNLLAQRHISHGRARRLSAALHFSGEVTQRGHDQALPWMMGKVGFRLLSTAVFTRAQTNFGSHPASCLMGTSGIIPRRVKRSNRHPKPMLRMRGAVTPLSDTSSCGA